MTTTDERALLAAIANDPADDTVRLVYADYLQENEEPEELECPVCQTGYFSDMWVALDPAADALKGRRDAANRRWACSKCDGTRVIRSSPKQDRAELIRVQVELESGLYLPTISERVGALQEPRYHELRVHEAAILRKYPEWQQVTCPACGGQGYVEWSAEDGGSPLMKCPFCPTKNRTVGTGHLPLVLRRGFPWRVTVPRLEQAGVEETCPHVGTDINSCPRCGNTGRRFVPTDHARKLLAALSTVGELVPGDRKPMYLDWDGVRSHAGWWNAARYNYVSQNEHQLFEPSDLPRPVWEQLTGFDGDNDFYRGWHTPEAAISALGATLAALVRGATC